MKAILQRVYDLIQEHSLFHPGEMVVVAVSGGPDSVCLLHVLWRLGPKLGITLHVAHLDHCLRGEESAADARFVADLAARLGLPATVEARDVTAYRRQYRLTMEEAAREVRYRFLQEVARRVGAVAVATGHTADDNVETILLHWLRGAGLAGLRGMAPCTTLQATGYSQPGDVAMAVRLVRPLLGLSRSDTLSYCREEGLAYREDSSNLDETILRNRLRLHLLPEMEKYNPSLRRTLLRAARAIADDYDYLQGQVSAAWPRVVRRVVKEAPPPSFPGPQVILDRAAFRALHPAIQRGILREALARVWHGWQDFGWIHLEAARQAVVAGRVGSIVHLPHHLALKVSYEEAFLGNKESLIGTILPYVAGLEPGTAMPLLTMDNLPVSVPGETPLPDMPWVLVVEKMPATAVGSLAASVAEGSAWEALADAEEVGLPLSLRRPRAGDRFQPLGMTGHKKLHDLFTDEKVPGDIRPYMPLLVSPKGIVWVGGKYLAHWARVRPETRWALRLRFKSVGFGEPPNAE